MANARALDKRRKSVRNIRKITRTMELIATARFKKAMDRAAAATDYTARITQVVSDLAKSGLEVTHPLLESRDKVQNVRVLLLSANRGLCGGYNGSVLRSAFTQLESLGNQGFSITIDASGKRGISGLKFRGFDINDLWIEFDDQPLFEKVEEIANGYLELYVAGKIDRLEVVYTKFVNISRQVPVVETLLPLGELTSEDNRGEASDDEAPSMYEFLPNAESILKEIVPTSFKVKLFKCFLDAAVSEQIARMVAMKAATENASEIIKDLSMTYNRARQSQITGEIMEIIGGVNALKG
ncbi:MAG: ATP synthase F1 subunit gamma [Pirellulaceae bacterium]|nr:ATP synthase F1 subunit gamma [Pirellulaceae bacterium]